MPSFVAHFESALDGTRLPARTLQGTHEGRPLWVRYDLERLGGHVETMRVRHYPNEAPPKRGQRPTPSLDRARPCAKFMAVSLEYLKRNSVKHLRDARHEVYKHFPLNSTRTVNRMLAL